MTDRLIVAGFICFAIAIVLDLAIIIAALVTLALQ